MEYPRRTKVERGELVLYAMSHAKERRTLPKLEYETLTERAYAALKQALIAGDYAPGQILVIRSLAESYGVSATPVREVLQRLVAERLLVMKSNRSIIVPYLEAETFNELCRIRVALEGMAIDRAVCNVSDEHRRSLRRILKDIDHSIRQRDIRTYVQLNQSFHFTLYDRANSPLLLEMIRDLWCRVGPFFRCLFDDDTYLVRANDCHRALVDALEARNGALVRQCLLDDIAEAARALTPCLTQASQR